MMWPVEGAHGPADCISVERLLYGDTLALIIIPSHEVKEPILHELCP